MDIQSFTPETGDKRDIKAVVIDLDGTLLDSAHSLSDRNRATVQKVIDANIPVILATGKTRYGSESVIAALNLQTPGIFVQGLIVTNPDGSIRHQQTLDSAEARRVITYAESRGFSVAAYSGNRLLTRAEDALIQRITDFGEPQPEYVGPLVNLLDTVPVHKLILASSSRKKITALRWQLAQQLDGRASMTTAAVLEQLEVLPAGASKGKALRVLMKEMGIPLENVMAIGDGENDMEMIKVAGWGVAVGNAHPKTKDVADVVVSSNDDGGVAEAIERFVTLPDNNGDDATETDPTESDASGDSADETGETA